MKKLFLFVALVCLFSSLAPAQSATSMFGFPLFTTGATLSAGSKTDTTPAVTLNNISTRLEKFWTRYYDYYHDTARAMKYIRMKNGALFTASSGNTVALTSSEFDLTGNLGVNGTGTFGSTLETGDGLVISGTSGMRMLQASGSNSTTLLSKAGSNHTIYLGSAAGTLVATASAPLAIDATTGNATVDTSAGVTHLATQFYARPYKVYVALLNQSGTSAPTATVLQNDLGFTPTYARTDAGIYTINSSAHFTSGKTWVHVDNPFIDWTAGTGYSVTSNAFWTSTSVLGLDVLETAGGTGVDTDSDKGLVNTAIEIRIYP